MDMQELLVTVLDQKEQCRQQQEKELLEAEVDERKGVGGQARQDQMGYRDQRRLHDTIEQVARDRRAIQHIGEVAKVEMERK